MAKIKVDTPLCTGELDAMVMQEPVFDLIIGNIKGLRTADAQEPTASKARKNIVMWGSRMNPSVQL